MARKQRDLKLEQVWRRHLEQQRSSGLTVRAYCRAHALRETAFFFWRKEIASRDRESSATSAAVPTIPSVEPSSPAFVPVAVVDSAVQHQEASIDIRLAEGHRVRVRTGCDRSLLADVLAMLRRPVPEGQPC